MVLALAAAPRKNPRRPRRGEYRRSRPDLPRREPADLRPPAGDVPETGRSRRRGSTPIRALHASLDRNGDGKLTTKEADPAIVAALVRLATGAAAARQACRAGRPSRKTARSRSTNWPRPSAPILGPFRLQAGRQAVGRTDALFDQLDRDKDGQLTRPELAAITGSLRPLDLDDNEMISADELEPFSSPAFAAMVWRQRPIAEAASPRSRRSSSWSRASRSLRPARLLLKKYDKGEGRRTGKARQQALARRVRDRPGRLRRAPTRTATARWTRTSCESSSPGRRST